MFSSYVAETRDESLYQSCLEVQGSGIGDHTRDACIVETSLCMFIGLRPAKLCVSGTS